MFGLIASLLASLFGAPSYDASLWSSEGVVPTYLPEAPQAPLRVFWPESGLRPSMNETVATEDILEAPIVDWRGDWRSLYTIMVVDFGVDSEGSNFVHWMEHNIRKSWINNQGVEVEYYDINYYYKCLYNQNIEYLAPWAFERNADNTAIVDTGDAALHPTGILLFK